MSFRIPCGGFELDENSFVLEDKKLSIKSVGGGGRYVVPVTWSDDGTPTLDPSVNAFDLIKKIKAGVSVVIEVPKKEPASGGYAVYRTEIQANSIMEHEEFETGEILNDYCAVLFGFMDEIIMGIRTDEYGTELI